MKQSEHTESVEPALQLVGLRGRARGVVVACEAQLVRRVVRRRTQLELVAALPHPPQRPADQILEAARLQLELHANKCITCIENNVL